MRSTSPRRERSLLHSLYRPQLTPAQLSALVSYRNRGVDHSLTYRFILSPIYDALIPLVPLHLAPNFITLSGFLLAFMGHLAVLYYSRTFSEPIPRWAPLFAGAGLLLYMVLDNLDGRQARRTRSSSPLGHLFDHGCDALNLTLSVMAFAATLRLGLARTLFFVLIVQASLFAATLEELVTGAMVLRNINGPNEGILTIVGAHLAAAAIGPALWTRPTALPLPAAWRVTHGHCMMAVSVTAAVGSGLQAFAATARQLRTLGAASLYAARCAPFVLYAFAYAVWMCLAPATFARSAIPALWTSALFVFDLVSRVILVHLTGSAPFPFVTPILPFVLALPAVAVAAKHFPALAHMVTMATAAALVAAAAIAGWRAACIIEQLCDYLNVHCLRLGPRVKHRVAGTAGATTNGVAPPATMEGKEK